MKALKEYIKRVKKHPKKILKDIKKLVINNKELLFLALPLFLIDIVTRILGNNIGFYKVYRFVPNAFTLGYIILFLGIVLNCKKPFGKIFYLFF